MSTKLKRFIYLKEICSIQTVHWVLFGFLVFYVNQKDQLMIPAKDIFSWLLLGFYPFLLFLIRTKFRKSYTMLFFHILSFPLVSLLPATSRVIQIFYYFLGFLYMASSASKTFKTNDRETKAVPPYLSVGLDGLLLVLLWFYALPANYFLYCIGILICFVFFFFAYFIDRYIHFITANSTTVSNMPQELIFRSGMGLVSLFIGTASMFSLMIAMFSIPEEISQKISGGIRKLIGYLLAFLFRESDRTADQEMGIPELGEDPFGLANLSQGHHIFWDILYEVLLRIAGIILIFLLFSAIFRLYKFLAGWFNKTRSTEVADDIDEDIHEKIISSGPGRVFREKPGDGIVQKIRYLYKRKVLFVHKNDRIGAGRITAREFAAGQNNPVFAEIYEKARYSNLSCNHQDLRDMQTAYRRSKVDH